MGSLLNRFRTKQEDEDDDDDDEVEDFLPTERNTQRRSEDLLKRRRSRMQSVLGIDFEEMRRLREMRRHSDNINRELRKLHKEECKIHKLLLLGTGNSGKSTFAKQMKIIHHIEGFTHEAKMNLVPQIRSNVRDAIVSLSEGLEKLEITLGDPTNQKMVDYMCNEAKAEDFDYPQVFYDYLSTLWQDKGIQACFKRSGELQLLDCTKYMFGRVDDIRQSDYVPSNQDVLRTRHRTTTVQKMNFTVTEKHKTVPFQLYDVGGQAGERRKWIQVFQDVNAIIFLVDISSYDVTMLDEGNRNTLIESIKVFEQVWNNKFLRNVSVLLFLNKIDQLDEKVSENRTFDDFVDKIDTSDPYHDFIKTWKSWSGPDEESVAEFLTSYPGNEVAFPKRRLSARGKRLSTMVDLMDKSKLQQGTVRTAVFMKKLFQHIISHPLPVMGVPREDRGSEWHRKHCLKIYFTCAVDTHTVEKVFESVKTFMLFKTLDEIG